jgi:23S rRNA maturation-related 3'-5' exoribonuclease YhaM
MADAYIRYTVNGKRHHATGDGLAIATETFNAIANSINKDAKLDPTICGDTNTLCCMI